MCLLVHDLDKLVYVNGAVAICVGLLDQQLNLRITEKSAIMSMSMAVAVAVHGEMNQ